ncbi:MAG TPA: CDP-glycerol glycerophosphotransferase family protein [Candidatus Angelobacter sp.]|nr:CDP-glycerol glycerophosphotransferase family protein [Candidatus Angelobacter sp.]
MKPFKVLPTLIARAGIRIVFRLACLFWPVNRDKITFASYRAEELKDNLAYIYEAWKKQGLSREPVFLLKRYRPGLLGKFDYFIHMIRASWHLATSRFFIIDDYFFPVYVIEPRMGTDIVQLWHAAGAFKKFGHSTINKSFGPSEDYLKLVNVHSNYTKVMVSGSEVIPYYAEAFNMPESRVLPLGVPRTDYFYDETANHALSDRFFKEYPELKGKTLLLYAPTFRGKSHDQGVFECPFDLKKLKTDLENYAVLVNLHPYMQKGMMRDKSLDGFVYMMDGKYNIQELLSLSDRLLTDYSSIIFDYSLLERPIAFFAHDLEDYELERGFYFNFRSFIPGPLFTETAELVAWLKSDTFDRAKVKAFKQRFFDHADGKSSERIVAYLSSIK